MSRFGTKIRLGAFGLAMGVLGGAVSMPLSAVAAPSIASLTPQAINFTPTADTLLTAGTKTVVATSDSGLTVTFASQTMSVCTVSGDTVTLVAQGTCTIRASQAGNGSYDPAPDVDDSFDVLGTPQVITFTAPAAQDFDDATVSVSASSDAGLTVQFTSGSVSVCTVSGTTVTFVKPGTCVIRADQPGNATYAAAARVTDSFDISKTPQTISWTPTADQDFDDATAQLAAPASSGLATTFSSATTGVCTVSGTTATFVTAGTCTVHADQAGNDVYSAATRVDDSFEIAKSPQTITFNAPATDPFDPAPIPLGATATSGLTVTYTSTTTSVCTVSGNQLTLLSVGTCTLRANQAGNGGWDAAPQVERSITVTQGTQTISFATPNAKTMADVAFAVAPSASSGLDVVVTSADPAVCTVAGLNVSLQGVGTCVLRANQAGNANYSAAPQVEVQFTVAKGAQTVNFQTPGTTPYTDVPFPLTATATSGLTVTFASLSPNVCTVAGMQVTLLSTGVCSLTADQAGDTDWNAAPQASVQFDISTGTQTITFQQPADVAVTGGPVQLAATAGSGLPVAFAGSTDAVCTVDATTVTLVAPGTCTITATQPGSGGWGAATPVQRSFSVTKGTQAITFEQPANRSFTDGNLTVAPTAASGLPVTLTTPSAGTCAVNGSVVVPLAAGDCVLHADQAGNGSWDAAARVSRTVVIAPGANTITFTAPAPAAISSGPVTLTGTASSGLPVTFTTGSSGICTVSGTAVTLVNIGDCVLTAAQAGDTRYAAAAPVNGTLAVIQNPVPVTVPTDAPPTPNGTLVSPVDPGETTAPGSTVTLSGSGYKPNTQITVVIYSTPIEVGTTMTDGAGAFSLSVVLPAGLETGDHTLVAAGLAPNNTLRFLSVEVAVAPSSSSDSSGGLPVTGGPVQVLASVGAWAVLLGVVMVVLGKPVSLRRRYAGRHTA